MIEAAADEPHHPDLEAPLSPPRHNYTCIIRTHSHTYIHTQACNTHTSWRQPAVPPPAGVLATFAPVSEAVNHHGATCTDIIARGGATLFCRDDISFYSLIITAVSRVCVFDSLRFPPSASLCVFASRRLQSDVMASVQNRRRLGIW